jgi:hypothetical protein
MATSLITDKQLGNEAKIVEQDHEESKEEENKNAMKLNVYNLTYWE